MEDAVNLRFELGVESSAAETELVIDFARTKSSSRDCDYSSSSLHPPWCRELLVPASHETSHQRMQTPESKSAFLSHAGLDVISSAF